MPFWAYAALHASWSMGPSKRDCRTAPRHFLRRLKQAGEFLKSYMRAGDAVLFKGSRGVQVEKALERAFERGRRHKPMLYWLLYEQLYPAVSGVPRFPLRHVAHTVCQPDFAVAVHLLGPWLIRKLREFQIGQHIREDGPKSHQKKAGTPTMGGILIIISIVGSDAAVGRSARRSMSGSPCSRCLRSA